MWERGSTAGAEEGAVVAAGGGEGAPAPEQVVEDGLGPHLAPGVEHLVQLRLFPQLLCGLPGGQAGRVILRPSQASANLGLR